MEWEIARGYLQANPVTNQVGLLESAMGMAYMMLIAYQLKNATRTALLVFQVLEFVMQHAVHSLQAVRERDQMI
jgi:hypothetical protein